MKTVVKTMAWVVFLLVFVAAGPAFCREKTTKYYWKIATVAPDGLGWSKHIKEVVLPVMKEVSHGEMELKVYWGAVLGDEDDYLRLIKEGKIQGAGLSAQGTVVVCPEMNVLELPFLFNNYTEVDYLRLKIDSYFSNLFKKKGLLLLGWIDQDFDPVFSTKYPMNTLADFSKSRFLSWYGPMEVTMLKALGAQVVPVSISGFSAAVNSGQGDAAIVPAVGIVGTQTHSKFRFINTIKMRYSPATLVLSTQAFKSLPAKYMREFYWSRLSLGWRYANMARRDNEKYIKALEQYGLKSVPMAPAEVASFKKITQKIGEQMAGQLYSREVLDLVMSNLSDYRAGKRLSMDDVIRFAQMDDAPLNAEQITKLKEITKKSLNDFGAGQGQLMRLD